MGLTDRLKHAWNAFTDSDSALNRPFAGGGGAGTMMMGRADRTPLRISGEKTIISSIYTRIGIDAAGIPMVHVRTDEDGRYLEDIDSGLNNCLTVEANLDQGARQFRQDVVMTLLDEGVCAIVPVNTSVSPEESVGGYDIKDMRVGRIVDWRPKHVRISLYNEERGQREDITLPKRAVAIVENPMYSVMNEPNSTLQRLRHKLSLLDAVDDQSASGKLDIIIQLPYVVKSESKRQQAEQRRKDIEFQLKGSKYGIAYSDATEKITQLNRPVENNLMEQVKYLTDLLYSQLGLTPEVMNGSADDKVMKDYHARTIEPILDAITEAMIRSFLTKTARTQGQSIMYFRDPFKFVPIGGEGGIADIADKFARNEITSSNEIRQGIGMKPRPEAKADALVNANMPQADTGVDISGDEPPDEGEEADPEADALIEDLSGTNSELEAALGEDE